MKKQFYVLLLMAVLLSACASAVPTTPAASPTETTAPATVTPVPPTITPTLEPSLTPAYAPEGLGPSNFPSNVNPLTGLIVADPSLLNRRPLLVKVSNLPRFVRPQWGLSRADIVFEYYTEEGSTRFAAVFYGNNADIVGPIRSARFVDADLVQGYKAVFAFGSAYDKVIQRLYSADYADRLVIESPEGPLTRYDPGGYDFLIVNTSDLSAYITQKGVSNGRQNLDGMFFKLEPPAGGQPAEHVFLQYSLSIYARWDYDAATGKYLRFSDTTDVFNVGDTKQYAQLTDRLTGQPIAFDNLVVLFVNHEYYSVTPEVMDIQFLGTGKAYAFRDGQVYQVTWKRDPDGVVTLVNADGTPFPFKPGSTWFQLVGLASTVQQTDQGWQFGNKMP
jgi:hypothetical protein